MISTGIVERSDGKQIVWYPKKPDDERVDMTVELLKDIRDNIRGVRTELREEIREAARVEELESK